MRSCIPLAIYDLVDWVMDGHTGTYNHIGLSAGQTYGYAIDEARLTDIHVEQTSIKQMQ